MNINETWCRITGSAFLRHLSVLMGGTLVAQLIPFALLPVLSRQYPPELFAALAVVMTSASLIGCLSTGYFEQALPAPRNHCRAAALASTALGLTLATTLLLILLLIAFAPWGERKLEPLVWDAIRFVLPVALCCGSISNIANYWLLRSGKPGQQAGIKLVHAVINSGGAILLGLMHVSCGLLVAFACGVALSSLWGGYQCFKNGLRILSPRHWPYSLRLMSHYRDFPLFGSLPALLNNLGFQLPLILVASTYSLASTGHFSVARNLLTSALLLIGQATGQMVLKHAAARQNAGLPLMPLFTRIGGGLFAIGLAITTTISILGPWFFNLYLGAGWGDSAKVLNVLCFSAPWILSGVALTPILIAIRRINLLAAWQTAYALLSGSLFFFLSLPIEKFLTRIVMVESLVFASALLLVFLCVKRHDSLLHSTKATHPR